MAEVGGVANGENNGACARAAEPETEMVGG